MFLMKYILLAFTFTHKTQTKKKMWGNLWCCDLKVDSQLGCGHHEGVDDVVPIPDPAHCQPLQWPIMLLEGQTRGWNICCSCTVAKMQDNVVDSAPAKWESQPGSGWGGKGQTGRWWWGLRLPSAAPPVWSDCTLERGQCHRVPRERWGKSWERVTRRDTKAP